MASFQLPSLANVIIESIPTPPMISSLSPVRVVHPALNKIMLDFPTFYPLRGAHFGTMTEAASILTNNKPGYFVRISDNRKIAGHRDSWVEPGDYYYFLDSNPGDRSFLYPVCSEFSAWTPVSPPAEWSQAHPDSEKHPDRAPLSELSETLLVRDDCCRISGRKWALQVSHIVPASENSWYVHHMMSGKINEYPATCHRASNLLTTAISYNAGGLGAGIFTFALVKNQIVVYTVSDNGSFAAHHHLQKVNLPPRIKVLHVWCRFAWSIIGMARDFIENPLVPKAILIPVPDRLQNDRLEMKRQEMDADEVSSSTSDSDSNESL